MIRSVKIMIGALGPYPAEYRGMEYLGQKCYHVDRDTLALIHEHTIRAQFTGAAELWHRALLEDTIGGNGLAMLSGYPMYEIDGYHIVEKFDLKPVHNMDDVKPVLLDGRYIDVLPQRPSNFRYAGQSERQDNVMITYHGRFDSLDGALAKIKELGFSGRNARVESTTDDDLASSQCVLRLYYYPQYFAADIAASLGRLPPEIYTLNRTEASKWIEASIEYATAKYPQVFWWDARRRLSRLFPALISDEIVNCAKEVGA